MWKDSAITKNPDGTFIVIHESAQGSLPYHVCSRDIDRANLFDIAEVSAFWESLPDTDPRKHVYIEPEPEPDTRSPAEKREDAYAAEADPLFRQYQYYTAEAEAWSLADDEEEAEEARDKALEYLVAYLEKKRVIRTLYPDEEASA